MMKFVVAALLFIAVSAVNVKCTQDIHDPAKHRWYQFDLSSLHHDESTYVDTLWYRTSENTIYFVNFCGQTASACDDPDTSVCIRKPGPGGDFKYVSGGSTSTQEITIGEDPSQSPATSVTVTYSKGEKCGAGYFKTKSYINCQVSATPGFFYDADESKDCETTLYMWSAAGCGKEIPGPSSSYSSSSSSSSVQSSSSSSDQCGGTVLDEKNKRAYHFDLSGLHHDDQTPIDTLWYRTDKNVIYYVNFCGQSAAGCSSGDTSVCIRQPNGSAYKFVSGGSTSSQNISLAEDPSQSPDKSVTVTYSHGDKCGNGYYTTKFYVNCQPGAIPGYIYRFEETNECEAVLYIWSAAGCGKEVPYH